MKAIVCTRSGPPEVLQLREVEKPVPGEREVLVKVQAATVTRGDVMLRKLHPVLSLPLRIVGVRRKRIPGHEFAGEVEAVGKAVTRFKPGDQVFGTTSGLSTGANAEFVCVPEAWKTGVIAVKPANMTYEEAASVPVAGMAALYILKQGHIQRGQKVLIYGATGSVGTYAVQLARHFEAEVTAVCRTRNFELVKTLGADLVLDYTKEDFAQNGQKYDVIFDAVGKTSASHSKGSLREGGTFLTVQSSTREQLENLHFLRDLAEAGELKAVIDRCFPLEQVAQAHRYVEQGTKVGNVVITL